MQSKNCAVVRNLMMTLKKLLTFKNSEEFMYVCVCVCVVWNYAVCVSEREGTTHDNKPLCELCIEMLVIEKKVNYNLKNEIW